MSSDPLNPNRQALQQQLRQTGIIPRRSAGQNFLIDSPVAESLVEAAAVQAGDTVLEIGPGFGAVTEGLLAAGASVLAVELDRRLAAYLQQRFATDRHLTVVPANVLRLQRETYVADGQFKLVASLPFNITSIVLREFLEHPPRPTLLSLLIQKEVAERAIAKPGSMSLLSVSVQYLGQPSISRIVPPTSFWPEPEVEAAILSVKVRPLPPDDERNAVFRIARIGFSSRRKMLHNNLDVGLRLARGTAMRVLTQLGLNPTCRAQDLSVEDWRKLAVNCSF